MYAFPFMIKFGKFEFIFGSKDFEWVRGINKINNYKIDKITKWRPNVYMWRSKGWAYRLVLPCHVLENGQGELTLV